MKGTYDKSQSIAVFMPIEHFADTFDFADGRFSGFLSDTKIKDIDESNIATIITIRDITKMADQLDHSMGSYMQYFQVLCILLSAVMIYLLTKLIIEKNETAISMTKILGYDNREIASLYLVSTSIVVVISDIISVVLGAKVMDIVWRIMLQTFSGWFSFHMTPVGYEGPREDRTYDDNRHTRDGICQRCFYKNYFHGLRICGRGCSTVRAVYKS